MTTPHHDLITAAARLRDASERPLSAGMLTECREHVTALASLLDRLAKAGAEVSAD